MCIRLNILKSSFEYEMEGFYYYKVIEKVLDL